MHRNYKFIELHTVRFEVRSIVQGLTNSGAWPTNSGAWPLPMHAVRNPVQSAVGIETNWPVIDELKEFYRTNIDAI